MTVKNEIPFTRKSIMHRLIFFWASRQCWCIIPVNLPESIWRSKETHGSAHWRGYRYPRYNLVFCNFPQLLQLSTIFHNFICILDGLQSQNRPILSFKKKAKFRHWTSSIIHVSDVNFLMLLYPHSCHVKDFHYKNLRWQSKKNRKKKRRMHSNTEASPGRFGGGSSFARFPTSFSRGRSCSRTFAFSQRHANLSILYREKKSPNLGHFNLCTWGVRKTQNFCKKIGYIEMSAGKKMSAGAKMVNPPKMIPPWGIVFSLEVP